MKTSKLKLRTVGRERYMPLIVYLAHGLYYNRERWFHLPNYIRVWALGEAYQFGRIFFVEKYLPR